MAAWSMFRRATRMKNAGSVLGWQTGEFQILECRGGDRRYSLPILWFRISRVGTSEAKTSVWLVEFTVEFEQSQCQYSEGHVGPYGFPGSDEPLEVTCEVRKFGDGLHAVFILPGWFSATAWKKYLPELMVQGK
jgi:hypothetical protein